jgi:hypothetical protein
MAILGGALHWAASDLRIGNMNPTVFILCAGSAQRCGGKCKQLFPIGRERLIERTLRLLRGRAVEPTIVTHLSELLGLGTHAILLPEATLCTAYTLSLTAPQWSTGKVVILLGDVIYSSAAIDRILFSGGLHLFGRKGPSRFTGKGHGEMFALTFEWEDHTRVLAAALRAVMHCARGGQGKLWETYYALQGLPDLSVWRNEGELLIEVDDETDDVDTVEQWEQYCSRVVGPDLLT